jgi:hypothetical protein
MIMKDIYETPAMDVVRFDCEDVITTSDGEDSTIETELDEDEN